MAEAVSLYRGPLLQGFTVADAPLFEEWVRFEESELRQAYIAALQRLAARAEHRQVWSEAIAYVQRLVQLDPLSEEVQRRLIDLYADNLPSQSGVALVGFQPVVDVIMTRVLAMRRPWVRGRPGVPEQLVMDARRALLGDCAWAWRAR